jgi:hypothetical protein
MIFSGIGASLGAISATMKEDEKTTKQTTQMVGAGFLAFGGSILALRTTLSLPDLSRTQRIAAANRISAAQDITKENDPEKKRSAFKICTDEDINVAGAFPYK